MTDLSGKFNKIANQALHTVKMFENAERGQQESGRSLLDRHDEVYEALDKNNKETLSSRESQMALAYFRQKEGPVLVPAGVSAGRGMDFCRAKAERVIKQMDRTTLAAIGKSTLEKLDKILAPESRAGDSRTPLPPEEIRQIGSRILKLEREQSPPLGPDL